MSDYKINLRVLSDKQTVLLSKLSYLDFDIEKYDEMKLNGQNVTVSDLFELLTNPDKSYLGIPDHKKEEIVGKIKISTQEEVIQELVDNGLGELLITDIACDPQISFKAIAFEDSHQNRGMSYSGTDFEKICNDSDDNLPKYLKESPEQIEAAKIFFKANKHKDDNNYLYGHSLGANLVSHIYLENHNKIERVYAINGVPIDKELLDTDEKIRAFSNYEKYIYNAIGGNPATRIKGDKEYEQYKYNVTYVENNGQLKDNPISNLLMECATYNNGEFEYVTKESAYNNRKWKPKIKDSISNDEQNPPEDLFEDLQEKMNMTINKVKKFAKNIFHKMKSFARGTKLLTDGRQAIKDSEDGVPQPNNEDKVLSFRERQQLKNYINEMYTIEDAIEAQEMSDNPRKFMEEKNKNEEKENVPEGRKTTVEDNVL